MISPCQSYHAPSNSGQVILGRTLPSLLDEACDRTPNPQAFQQWTRSGWQPLSNQAFRVAAEAIALGLLDLGLETGDRVALLMPSNLNFCLVDMGCLLAGVVDVPIDLTQTIEGIIYILRHSEAKAMIVSTLDLLTQLSPYLQDTPALQLVIIAEVPADWDEARSQWSQVALQAANQQPVPPPDAACLAIPSVLHPAHAEPLPYSVSRCISLLSLQEMQQEPRSPEQLAALRTRLDPHDLATIIYIPDANGQLQGVMLTHENLSANALAAFSGLSQLHWGAEETILSFLPLNHVFARALIYGHIYYGHSIYFSSPNRVIKHLQQIRPTIVAIVPLLLEKIYSKILETGERSALVGRWIFQWALKLAQRYELGTSPTWLERLQLKLADWLVLSRWRSLFGGRIKYILCGGAALRAELVNEFAAAGVTILQGYGLTQTSSVVSYNREAWNRAGTVGVPMAGVELTIAPDREILVRGPCVMSGYYKNPLATAAAIDAEGWFHTGDMGNVSDDGFLTITGTKKALFKLSTGKYIAPQPIEERLNQSTFVERAIVVGANRNFSAVLIVPNVPALHTFALQAGLNVTHETLMQHPYVLSLYHALITAANCHLPYWSTIRRFRLIAAVVTSETGLLTLTEQLDRAAIWHTFANEIEALYRDVPSPGQLPDQSMSDHSLSDRSLSDHPLLADTACPPAAQSLNPRLTT